MNQLSLLLLVDSDPKGLETLKYGFEREGCAVAGTSDPAMAPELARTTTPQLAVISVREPQTPAFDLIAKLRSRAETKNLPLVTLGPEGMRAAAMAAGASDFLTTPLFFRDVISVGKLMLLIQDALAGNPGEIELSARLSEYYGLYYLLRAISGTGRSGILQLNRGNRKGEIRFSEGAVTSAQVGPLQGFPALHQLLLWEEAALSLKLRSVLRRGQFSLSPSELLEECERFLRDFTHAARDLGPAGTVYVQHSGQTHWAGLVASDVGPLLRLFDGHRTVSEVIEESPFRIFDTLRVVKRLLDNGGLVVKAASAATPLIPKRTSRGSEAHATLRPAARAATPVQLNRLPDQRSSGGDRRKSNRHRTLSTPAPGARTTAPIPLTVKKTPSVPIGATPIAARKQQRTPPPVTTMGDAPTVQMKLDAPARLPTPEPIRIKTPAPATTQQIADAVAGIARRFPTPSPPLRPLNGEAHLEAKPEVKHEIKHEKAEAKPDPKAEAKARLRRSSPSLTPTSAFDAVESDFFAREADLYKHEVVESFDDLERGTDPKLRLPTRSQPHNARKKR
jgi:CheY-like chemotaxis protein